MIRDQLSPAEFLSQPLTPSEGPAIGVSLRSGYSIVRVWALDLGKFVCAHHQILVDRSWILLSKIKNFGTFYLILINWWTLDQIYYNKVVR